MEFKRLTLCLAFFVLAYISHCSEGRHSLVRRAADETNDVEGINEEAKMVTEPTVYNVNSGATVRLACKVSPADDVMVKWTMNNTDYFIGTLKISSNIDDRFSIAPDSTDLLIRDVKPTDSGLYTCEILQANPVKISHNLVVLESPRILSIIATGNGQLIEGSDLVLTCDVSGSPPPRILWSRYENGVTKRLQSHEGMFLGNTVIIRNVRSSHSGTYHCHAFNALGTDQAEINVVVRESGHSRVRRATDEANYDELQNDEGADDEAQNDAEGNDEEETAVVAKIVTEPAVYNVTIGRTVRLECKVSPAVNVVVQWTRNNTNYFLGTQKDYEQRSYSVDDRFTIAANSTDLLIRDVKPTDSGLYTCEVLQVNPVKISHNLVVLESPRILRFTATGNGQLVEGADLQLTCDVSGSPPPKIVWSKDEDNVNKRLQENDATFLGNTVLIKNVRPSHSGKYYCYAFNGIGTNQAEIDITVRGKPLVHVSRTVVNSAFGVEAILECAVHGDAASHIRWYKDGQRIEDSSRAYSVSTEGQRSNLTVIPRQDADFGTFTCEAENEHGSHNRSIDLVQSPVLEGLQVDGPKVSLTIHSHQPLEVIELQLRPLDGDAEWKILNVPVPQSSNPHEYQVDYSLENDLTSGGKYEVTVKVKNVKSWSAHTNPAIVEYETRPQPIQHASVYRGNSAHSIAATPFILLTAFMYLLVRM